MAGWEWDTSITHPHSLTQENISWPRSNAGPNCWICLKRLTVDVDDSAAANPADVFPEKPEDPSPSSFWIASFSCGADFFSSSASSIWGEKKNSQIKTQGRVSSLKICDQLSVIIPAIENLSDTIIVQRQWPQLHINEQRDVRQLCKHGSDRLLPNSNKVDNRSLATLIYSFIHSATSWQK